jgi:exosortase
LLVPPPPAEFEPVTPPARSIAGAVVLACALGWAYLPLLADMVTRWSVDPQYSHGFLVPLFSAYLLWQRRGVLAGAEVTGRWAGVGLVVAAVGMRAAGTLLFFNYLDGLSFLLAVAGLVTVWGGRAALRWAAPAVVFLLFMLPLPFAAQTILTGTLQAVGAKASTYLLVTFGVPAVAEGNVILLSGDVKLGVVGACSGLGLAYSAVAIAVALLFLFRPPAWAAAVLLLSTVPVAVAGNVVRITATGLLYQQSQSAAARTAFHDAAGWVMMPVAVACFCFELWYLNRLVRERVRAEVAGVLLS